MPNYQFYNDIDLTLSGEGNVADKLHGNWEYFETKNNIPDPDIRISCVEHIQGNAPDVTFGSAKKHYYKSEEYLISNYFGDKFGISFTNNELIYTNGSRQITFLRRIAEYFLRKNLLEKNKVMLHSSAVYFNNKTLLFPGWRHTGKTNTLLTLLHSGASYLADDRVFIDDNRTAFAFPTRLHLDGYNYRSFPELKTSSKNQIYRARLHNYIDRITGENSSFFSRGLNMASNAFIRRSGSHNVEQVFPEVEILDSSADGNIIFLKSSSGSDVELSEMSQNEFVRKMKSVNYREWDSGVLKLANIYDLLFHKDKSKLSEVEEFINRQEKAFESMYLDGSVYELNLPANSDTWTEKTKKDIINVIKEV